MTTDDRTNSASSSVYSSEITMPDQVEFQPLFTNVEKLPPYSLLPGITMQTAVGNRIMMTWVTIEPNTVVPPHQHPQEQTGVVLEGVLTLEISGESRDLKPGDIYTIPPNLPHSALSKEGCKVLDIFSPARDDFLPYSVH